MNISRPLKLIVLVCCYASLSGAATRDQVADRVERVRPELKRYDDILERRLFITPADCGRIVIDGQTAVSIYHNLHDNKAVVTLTTASDSLYNDDVGQLAKTKVTQIDAAIPSDLALAIRDVWNCVLRQQTPNINGSIPKHVVLDGMTAVLSLKLPNGSKLEGQMPIGSQYWGPQLRDLWALSETLVKYCKAEPAKRQSILAKLRSYVANARRYCSSAESKQKLQYWQRVLRTCSPSGVIAKSAITPDE